MDSDIGTKELAQWQTRPLLASCEDLAAPRRG
jgi:hypothetical protein